MAVVGFSNLLWLISIVFCIQVKISKDFLIAFEITYLCAKHEKLRPDTLSCFARQTRRDRGSKGQEASRSLRDTDEMKKAWRPLEGQEAKGRPGGQGMEAKGRHWTATLGGKMPGA